MITIQTLDINSLQLYREGYTPYPDTNGQCNTVSCWGPTCPQCPEDSKGCPPEPKPNP